MKPASIRTFPDPILRKKTQAVTTFDRSLLKLVATLVRAMEGQPHGIGIAAPQIGVAKAVAIVDVSKRDLKAKRLILVNPVILEKKEPEARKEGCMSFPDYTAFLMVGDLIEYNLTSIIFTKPSKKITEDYITGRFG